MSAEEKPTQEELELLGWGWQHVPGIVLGYVVSGRKSLLEQIRKIRDEGMLTSPATTLLDIGEVKEPPM